MANLTAKQKLENAIDEAKQLKETSILELNKIAEKHKILGILSNNPTKNEFIAWTAKVRVTL